MITLLCTIGTSPLVVPELFLMAPDQIRTVHGLTSASPDVKLEEVAAFFAGRPEVACAFSRIEGFDSLSNQAEHNCFEEALLRWFLARSREARDRGDTLWVGLSGGFKTMSSGIHKAAHLIGADLLVHVLVDAPFPQTLADVQSAHETGRIRLIELGTEPGWAALRDLDPGAFPLATVKEAGAVRWVAAGGDGASLRERVNQFLEEASRKLSAWDDLPQVPFTAAAMAPAPVRAWLRAAVDPDQDRAWLRALPKVELHCHLGGFATDGPALEQVRAAAERPLPARRQPEPRPEGWPRPAAPVTLAAYRAMGDATGSALLTDRGCLIRQVQLLHRALVEDGVRYAEVRCSPDNYSRSRAGGQLSAWEVLELVRETFQQEMDAAWAADPEGGCHVNLIVIATRTVSGDLSSISRHVALAVAAAQHTAPTASSDLGRCRVVGVDLAGAEEPATRPHHFAAEFEVALRCGLAVTAHAGETDDAESIWQAVHRLHARRIGHGLRLVDAPDLMRTVADRKIGVELCPYANFQIHGFAPMTVNGRELAPYPLRQFLEAGVAATVNTDNIGISAATLSENLAFAGVLCPGLTRLDVLRIQRNGLESAFVTPTEREILRRRMERGIEAALKRTW